jgi:uroporphyrinogen decarboxylase
MSRFTNIVSRHERPLAMPILAYPGTRLINATVRDIVTDPVKQASAQLALHKRFNTEVLLAAMDLSAEVEAFGGKPVISDWEVPAVPGRVVTDATQVRELAVPAPGAGRTGVYLEVVRLLRQAAKDAVILGGMIGPFSLAARLYGVSETLQLTIENTDLLNALLEKSTKFLTAYALAFKAGGADGVIMAEPTAGLLSPRALRDFSSVWVRRIVDGVEDSSFTLVYHSCSVKPVHLEAAVESGAKAFHFGAPMDIPAALNRVPQGLIVCGNLDPTNVFYRRTPTEVETEVRRLLAATTGHRNFVLSSGCDIPPRTPVENIEAFFRAAHAG